MKNIKITVNGKEYPCRPTLGAMLRFKKETGREVTEIEQGSLSDVSVYLWCCIVSACKHDGIEFRQSLMDFADSIGPEDMTAWKEAVQGEAGAAGGAEEGEKKSP